MIRINLLPVKTQAKQQTGINQILLFIGVVAIVFVAVGLVWLNQRREISHLKPKAARLRAELAKYKNVERRLKRLKESKQQVEKRIEIINRLQKDRDSIVRVLAILTDTIPKEKMWFNGIHESGRGITIDGVAISNEAISEFMRNLEGSIYIGAGHVNLIKSVQKKIAGKKLRAFQIRFVYRTPSQIKQFLAKRKKGSQKL